MMQVFYISLEFERLERLEIELLGAALHAPKKLLLIAKRERDRIRYTRPLEAQRPRRNAIMGCLSA